ncbi:MAG: dipeptide/oligopeptide/nickel ABC transporter ATP-binding protein, partial [Bacteroidota bacterium]
ARLLTVDDFLAAEEGREPEAPLLPEDHLVERIQHLVGQTPILEVSDLKTWFGGEKPWWGPAKPLVKAVDSVSFSLYPGETLGLVGESGSGKTTLGRSVLALVRPTGGEVRYKGKDLLGLDRESLRAMRKEIQIIFQDPFSTLNPRMTVEQTLMEPMMVHKLVSSRQEARSKVAALLDRVQLPSSVGQRYPHAFSGGQRQRISIARALAVSPTLIVCDESVSALDVSVQAQILNLLKELQTEMGLTYLFISHDLSVVRFMSDRIMVMQHGKLVELGRADLICEAPEKVYTQQLLSAIPPGSPAEIEAAIAARKARLVSI